MTSSIFSKIAETAWPRFWMRHSHRRFGGRIATRLAGLFLPPYYGRVPLSRLNFRGYISPLAQLAHPGVMFGRNCFVGDRVLFYRDRDGGAVRLGDRVHIHQDTTIQTGLGGSAAIGAGTHIQPRCQISAYVGSVNIGERVEIAPNCAFYPYNHGLSDDPAVREQPLESRGGIFVGDDVWVGFGAIVLDGVRIGERSVIGAGAVVTSDIPPECIAVGVPAQVIGIRGSSRRPSQDVPSQLSN